MKIIISRGKVEKCEMKIRKEADPSLKGIDIK